MAYNWFRERNKSKWHFAPRGIGGSFAVPACNSWLEMAVGEKSRKPPFEGRCKHCAKKIGGK